MIQFYEKVVVQASLRFPDYIGRKGIVLGISEDDDCVYSYSVFFDGETEGRSFLPAEVIGTGEILDRTEFYDAYDVVKVSVKSGNGSLM